MLMRCLFLFLYINVSEESFLSWFNLNRISLKVGIVLIILKAFIYSHRNIT